MALRGSTGAHVERIVRIARRRARKLERELLLEDLFAALGEKLADLPREYLERIAIHEAGHAVAAVVLKVSRNVSVSLFHLGEGSAATYFDPQIEAVTRKVVERRIAVALAGRAAEQVLLGDVTAGAGGSDTSDLAMANTLAFSAVARWGLGDVDQLKWLAGGPEQIVSTHPELAAEAYTMLDVANKRALALIRRRMTEVRAIAGALMKRRALAHEDILALLTRRRTREARRQPRGARIAGAPDAARQPVPVSSVVVPGSGRTPVTWASGNCCSTAATAGCLAMSRISAAWRSRCAWPMAGAPGALLRATIQRLSVQALSFSRSSLASSFGAPGRRCSSMLPAGSKRTRLTCSSRCTLSLTSRRSPTSATTSANVRRIGTAAAAGSEGPMSSSLTPSSSAALSRASTGAGGRFSAGGSAGLAPARGALPPSALMISAGAGKSAV